MNKHRTASGRPMGRPLKGDERLDVQLTVKVTRSMDEALRMREDVPAFVRRAIERALGSGGGRARTTRRKAVRPRKTKHRK